jgi:hypothetical protein
MQEKGRYLAFERKGDTMAQESRRLRRAEAIIDWMRPMAEQMPQPEQGIYVTGILRGLTLGLALGHLDPQWAEEAFEELREAIETITELGTHLGVSMKPPEEQRLFTLTEAQAIIRASAAPEDETP